MRVAVLAFALVGCGASAQDIARVGLTTTAYAVVQADKAFAESYRLASDEARATSTTQAEKDAQMVEWDRAADEVERVVGAVYAGLGAAEIALDVWEQTDDVSAWDEALGCLVAKLTELAKVLEERGVEMPRALRDALRLGAGLECAG